MSSGPFFTSDLHLFHKNICKPEMSNRPWASVEEMNDALVQRYNEVVPDNGTCYFLGDLSFGTVDSTSEILKRMNGIKLIIPGNHDDMKDLQVLSMRGEITILPRLHEIKLEKKTIVLCHYPMFSWNKSHYGTLHLHGHCHGKINAVNAGTRRVDVGVDARPTNDFMPWSWGELKERYDPQ